MRIKDIRLHLADAQRLAADELAAALTAHRTGDAEAAEKLRTGFQYLVWEALLRSADLEDEPGHKDPERLSELYNLLARAVAKLADSDLATENAVGFVVGYLTKGRDQKKRGHLKRISDRKQRGRWEPDADNIASVTLTEDPRAPLPAHDTYGRPYRRPSRFDQPDPSCEASQNELDELDRAERLAEYERLIPFASSPAERAALQGLRDDRLTAESQAALQGYTPRQVAAILERLRERARLCNLAA